MISRSVPEPFKRPSIDLDRSKRVWQWVLPFELTRGDILQNFGRVKDVVKTDSSTQVLHDLEADRFIILPNTEKVYAFSSK